VDPAACFEFDADRYAPSWYYDGHYRFKRHYVRPIGELKSAGEEYECAVRFDQLDEVECWMRNLDSRPETSLWLQTSTDRFYPDFVARLRDGRIFVLEYKGEDRWSNDDSKEKRALGELWAERSGGPCLFVMPKGPDWRAITACVEKQH
jgi:type III restriction enzyme